MMGHESGHRISRSRSNEKDVTTRWQLNRRENENKLPLEFGRGAKKVSNSAEALRCAKDAELLHTTKQPKKRNFSGNNIVEEDTNEYQRGGLPEIGNYQGQREGKHIEETSTLDISSCKDENSSIPMAQENIAALQTDVITLDDDDEPTIDRPEDYLNASSCVSTYHQPSFVPDRSDETKVFSLAETSKLSQTQDLGDPGQMWY